MKLNHLAIIARLAGTKPGREPGGSTVLAGVANEPDAAVSAYVDRGRWGRPEEMGYLVAFLCSPKAAFVTGETIRIDGGYTKSLF